MCGSRPPRLCFQQLLCWWGGGEQREVASGARVSGWVLGGRSSVEEVSGTYVVGRSITMMDDG